MNDPVLLLGLGLASLIAFIAIAPNNDLACAGIAIVVIFVTAAVYSLVKEYLKTKARNIRRNGT